MKKYKNNSYKWNLKKIKELAKKVYDDEQEITDGKIHNPVTGSDYLVEDGKIIKTL